MGLTFRAKLYAIVAVAAVAFSILIVTGAVLSSRVEAVLLDVQQRFLPRMEIGPRLEGRMGIARSIRGRVADLGGTIELESSPGTGVEWELRLPRRAEVAR